MNARSNAEIDKTATNNCIRYYQNVTIPALIKVFLPCIVNSPIVNSPIEAPKNQLNKFHCNVSLTVVELKSTKTLLMLPHTIHDRMNTYSVPNNQPPIQHMVIKGHVVFNGSENQPRKLNTLCRSVLRINPLQISLKSNLQWIGAPGYTLQRFPAEQNPKPSYTAILAISVEQILI